MKAKPKTQEEMFPIIESYQSFKGNVKTFLEAHEGITEATFYYWFAKYKKSKQPQSTKPAFIKLKPKKVPQTNIPSVSIYLPNGIRISIDQPMSPDYFTGIATSLSKVSA